MSDETNSILQMLYEVTTQNQALYSVCATLIAEIALLHPAPRDKIAEITAGLQGMAHAVAAQMGGERSRPLTKAIDAISTLAENALAMRTNRSTDTAA